MVMVFITAIESTLCQKLVPEGAYCCDRPDAVLERAVVASRTVLQRRQGCVLCCSLNLATCKKNLPHGIWHKSHMPRGCGERLRPGSLRGQEKSLVKMKPQLQ